MSGNTNNAFVHQRMLGVGVDFIRKPFALDALASDVSKVLDARIRA
jgi:hypothetical protein